MRDWVGSGMPESDDRYTGRLAEPEAELLAVVVRDAGQLLRVEGEALRRGRRPGWTRPLDRLQRALGVEDIALGYQQVLHEAGPAGPDGASGAAPPIYHRREQRIHAHVLLCWPAQRAHHRHLRGAGRAEITPPRKSCAWIPPPHGARRGRQPSGASQRKSARIPGQPAGRSPSQKMGADRACHLVLWVARATRVMGEHPARRPGIDLGGPGRLAWIIVTSQECRFVAGQVQPSACGGYTVIRAIQLLGLLCCPSAEFCRRDRSRRVAGELSGSAGCRR